MSKEGSTWPIVGNQSAVDYLQRVVATDAPAHAYLFSGPGQVGKTTVARQFIAALLCTEPIKPCGACQHCRQLASGIHPDITWLVRLDDEKTGVVKKNVSIEQVRTAIAKLTLHAFGDGYKVLAIEEAERLSTEAANALLKTLEEPTSKTVIILISSHSRSLPPTLVSRCQPIRFGLVSQPVIAAALTDRGVDSKKAKRLAAIAYGRPGVAINYSADQDSYRTYQQVAQALVALPQKTLLERFTGLSGLVESFTPAAVEQLLTVWLKVWRDVLLYQQGVGGLASHESLRDQLGPLSRRYQVGDLTGHLEQLANARQLLRANVNPRLLLENLVLTF